MVIMIVLKSIRRKKQNCNPFLINFFSYIYFYSSLINELNKYDGKRIYFDVNLNISDIGEIWNISFFTVK